MSNSRQLLHSRRIFRPRPQTARQSPKTTRTTWSMFEIFSDAVHVQSQFFWALKELLFSWNLSLADHLKPPHVLVGFRTTLQPTQKDPLHLKSFSSVFSDPRSLFEALRLSGRAEAIPSWRRRRAARSAPFGTSCGWSLAATRRRPKRAAASRLLAAKCWPKVLRNRFMNIATLV